MQTSQIMFSFLYVGSIFKVLGALRRINNVGPNLFSQHFFISLNTTPGKRSICTPKAYNYEII